MDRLKNLLEEVASGSLAPVDAMEQFYGMGLSFEELGHTKLDLSRCSRRGVPEVVYGATKTAEQILEIAIHLDNAHQTVLCTRVSEDKAQVICAARPDFVYHSVPGIILKRQPESPAPRGLVAVMSAGTSDLPVLEEAAICLEAMGSKVERVHDVGVAGIHRLFSAAENVLRRANVVIVIAGMEGALPSVVAGLTDVPVIAVPTSIGYGASFGGISALLGMLTACSGGIGVVNIDNGFGAAMLAHLINCPAHHID